MKSETEHDQSDPNCCRAMNKSLLQFSEKTYKDLKIAKKNWKSLEFMLHYHNVHLGPFWRRVAPNFVCFYCRLLVVTDSLSILVLNGLYVIGALRGNDDIDIFLTGVWCM